MMWEVSGARRRVMIVKYVLLYFAEEKVDRQPADPVNLEKLGAWLTEMEARGVRRHGHRLRPVAEAATVRVREHETLVSDGPFAETKEQVAGYDLIECVDLTEALEIASKHPAAELGTVEVRPVWM